MLVMLLCLQLMAAGAYLSPLSIARQILLVAETRTDV